MISVDTSVATSFEKSYAYKILNMIADGIDNFTGMYKVEHTEGILLVDPINGNPFIFQFPTVISRYSSDKPASGTEKLVMRVKAGLMFETLVAKVQADNQRCAQTNPTSPQIVRDVNQAVQAARASQRN